MNRNRTIINFGSQTWIIDRGTSLTAWFNSVFVSRGTLYSSSIDCLRKTIKQEGLVALYKGFLPIWMRMAPWSLTFWLTYEEAVKLMGAKSW